jgi:hypothetical protein
LAGLGEARTKIRIEARLGWARRGEARPGAARRGKAGFTMTPRKQRVAAASLILDYNLYPRHKLSPVNIRTISQAVAVGEQIPPVIADQASRRVIDGFHRVTEALRRDGDVAVEWHDYADDAAMLVDAIARNARHGMPLEPFDRARCIELAADVGVGLDRLAGALAVNVDILGELHASRTAYDPDGKPVTIKRNLRHKAGSKLTGRQVEANRRSSGWPVRFHAEQIILAVEADLVPDDEATRVSLGHLLVLLQRMAVPT